MKSTNENNVDFISSNTGGLVSGSNIKKRDVTLKTATTEPEPGFAQASPNFKEVISNKVEASEEDKEASLKENIVDVKKV